MQYRPDLDGLRALAVVAVLLSHSGIVLFGGGWLGVDVFFVLSGYLITTLLIKEHASTGRVDLTGFYARRMLRLYPALLLLLLVGALFYRELGAGGNLEGYGLSALLAGTYVQDIVQGLTQSAHGGLGHTWSLGVEEQFYLLWPPVLLLLIGRRRSVMAWSVFGGFASWVVMLALLNKSPDGIPDASYYLPVSRFSGLLLGSATAAMLDRQPPGPLWTRAWLGWSAAVLGVTTLAAAGRLGRYPDMSWESPLMVVATVILLVHLAAGPSVLHRLLAWTPLSYVGRRSYGIYLFHAPVFIVLAAHLSTRRLLALPLMVVTTMAVAMLSYHYVELPFLRLKQRVGRRSSEETAVAACDPPSGDLTATTDPP